MNVPNAADSTLKYFFNLQNMQCLKKGKKKNLKKKKENQQTQNTHVTWLPRFKLKKKIKNFTTTDHLKPEIPQNFLLV